MRYLSILSWKPENAKEITERFKQWKRPEGITYLLPPHTVIGQNKSISVAEIDDPMAMAKIDRYWRDISVFEVYPIMESADIIKVKP
jgi:hypothetical protein